MEKKISKFVTGGIAVPILSVIGRWSLFVLVVLVGAGFFEATALAHYNPPVDDEDYDEANEFIFLDDEVAYIYVTMDPDDLQEIIDDPFSDEYRVCIVRFVNSKADETVEDVGIRARGGYSRNYTKFPWKLSFNKFVSGRKFHGLKKFNMNSDAADPSISRSKLLLDVFRAMGVPASRAHHVYLKINDGADVEGVYLNVEQVDDEFVQAWFGNDDGNLYKCRYKNGGKADLMYIPPGTPEVYRDLGDGETYEEQINDGDFVLLAEFIDFVNNSDPATFAAEIDDWLNIDLFTLAMAVDVAGGNWDGYWYGANNYYLYQNTETGRIEYIPWDLDNGYGMCYPIPFWFGIDWATRDYEGWGDDGHGSTLGELPPLIARVLEIPEYNDALLRSVHEAVEGPFGLADNNAKLNRIKQLLEPLAFQGSFSGPTMDWNYTNEDFVNSFNSPNFFGRLHIPATWGLRPFIRRRVDYVRNVYPQPMPLPKLFVNEAVADNESIIQDEVGEYEDYAEIYNDESSPIDVGGMYLSDYAGAHQMWRIPDGTVIPPKGFILVWCDKDAGDGPLHTNFKLSSDGEGVWLFDKDANKNVLIDYLTFPKLNKDESFGRFPDGSGVVGLLSEPSPGESNAGPGSGLTLTIDGGCPGRVSIYASGATPGGAVAFFRAFGTGSVTLERGPCAGTVLGLNSTVNLMGTSEADVHGTATLTDIIIHEKFCGHLYIQALDLTSCETSQVEEPKSLLVDSILLTTHTTLLPNYPNPFNPDTWLPYQLAQDALVTIRIYNTKGQLIRSLHLGTKQAGSYITKERAAYWDGRDNLAQKVASGVYFYTLQVRSVSVGVNSAIPSIGAGQFTETRKMLILK